MALVCDIKSDSKDGEKIVEGEENNAVDSSAKSVDEDDLEDGEIEDDEDEDMPEQLFVATPEASSSSTSIPILPDLSKPPPSLESPPIAAAGIKQLDEKKRDDKKRHEKKHLTEAEKSVMRLHKMERMEREKREKYRREQVVHTPQMEVEEDFATSLEKALAKVLKKDKTGSEDEKRPEETEKRCKKRKRRDKHNKKMKKCKQDSPKDMDEMDDSDMYAQGCSRSPDDCSRTTNQDNEESYDSEASSSDKSRETRVVKIPNKRFDIRNKNMRDKSRDHSNMQADKRNNTMSKTGKRNTGVCLHYLQGHCDDDNCPYSHETVQPMKLELCKFYLLECCAKGDKCLYMHSDFPCKYYHTGIPCPFEETCKFAHGGPLSEGLKQILFKHIETAPKEILGNFPRLSRENASVMIIQAQKNLEIKYGPIKKDNSNLKDENIPSLMDVNIANVMDGGSAMDNVSSNMLSNPPPQIGVDNKNRRNRPSRWQDPEPAEKAAQEKPLAFGTNFKDQDMRISSFSSNGDVDMRTLNLNVGPPKIHPTNIVNPNILATNPATIMNILTQQQLQMLNQNNLAMNVDQQQQSQQSSTTTLDIEKYKMDAMGKNTDISASVVDTDIRNTMDVDARAAKKESFSNDDDDCDGLQIVMDEEEVKTEPVDILPKSDLIKRIQVQSKDEKNEDDKTAIADDNDENNPEIDWYSDDEDENKLTIRDDDFDEVQSKDEPKEAEPAPVKPLDMIGKLGDLSKIDISAEVTKLLSSINQTSTSTKEKDNAKVNRDPRLVSADPRRNRVSSTEDEQKKSVSIYNSPKTTAETDQDLRSIYGSDAVYRPGSRPDVDLRQMAIPFKGIENYTPATEIDASISSHPPVSWSVKVVDIPKPDYTGLKLSYSDAQANGDPRLRKIFRLSTEEVDSPASPKESPKVHAPSTPRVDPRRRKMEAEAASSAPRTDIQTPMNYNQQLTMLQTSPFYQTLTSNQKVMLNQEISMNCTDKSGQNDPVIASILLNLGLVAPGSQNAPVTGGGGGQAQAVNILNNVNNLVNYQQNPPIVMPPVNPNMGPGLLGAGPPGMQNLPTDYPMNFNAGILGNGPPPPFQNNYPPQQENNPNNFGNFTDDYYPDQPPPQQQQQQFNPNQNNNNNNNMNNNRDNRGFRENNNNRGGRNRGRNNNRNNRNFFRRHNRNNRNNSP